MPNVLYWYPDGTQANVPLALEYHPPLLIYVDARPIHVFPDLQASFDKLQADFPGARITPPFRTIQVVLKWSVPSPPVGSLIRCLFEDTLFVGCVRYVDGDILTIQEMAGALAAVSVDPATFTTAYR